MFLRLFPKILLCALLLCSCNQDDQQQTKPESHNVKIEFSTVNIPQKSVEFALTVEADCEWSFDIDSTWAYVIEPKSQYSGSAVLSIRVKANETVKERSAVMHFIWDDGRDSLIIIQDPFQPYLEVSEKELTFGNKAAEKVILVTSNCGWEASSLSDWISFKPSTGLVGNFDMTINVGINNTGGVRISEIRIVNKSYNLEQIVRISQNGKSSDDIKNYVDEYGIDHGYGITIGDLEWAPVNCGFKESEYPFGKMYQWGRKNGVGYHSQSFSDAGSTLIADAWAGENGLEEATTFYKYSETGKYGYDWIFQGDDSFWNLGTEENPVKNPAFDPCPDGWRIPTAFEMKSLIDYAGRTWTLRNNINGYDFDGLFLPACGRLNILDGAAYDRNIEGYYWTITGKNGSASYLYFYEKDCSINSQGSRAGGCAVRCVRE